MKKFILNIILVILFFLIYILQITFFNTFSIFGVKPNLFILLVLFIGLYIDEKNAMIFGIFAGICMDLLGGKIFGISSIMLAIVGIISGVLAKNWKKEQLQIVLMFILLTICYEVGSYILSTLLSIANFEILAFIKKLIIEVIYNVLILMIFYPLIQKIGCSCERIFNKTEILTRYY